MNLHCTGILALDCYFACNHSADEAAELHPGAGQVVFFVPYLSMTSDGARSTDDLFSFGKIIFLGIIGAVSLEVPRPPAY